MTLSPETPLLFDDATGCLTDYALDGLVAGSLDEMGRLEAAEHLSYCDSCLDRYTLRLAPETLLDPPELMKHSILSALRRRAANAFVSRYFHMAVAASLTLVLWGSGVFASFGQGLPLDRFQFDLPGQLPEITVSQRLDSFASSLTGGISDFMDQLADFELRGALVS